MNILKFSLIFLFFSQLNAQEQKLEPISLQLQWKHQFEFAGFYAAKEKGFYKDVGLDVSFIEYHKDKNIVDEVLKNKAEYGLSYSSIIADYLNGKPIIFLANFFKQSPLVLITQENIKTPADLKGKKIMGVSDSIDNITLLLMLNKFNVKLEDITTLSASFKIESFINKEIDAMSVFTTNELFNLNQRGIKYKIFDPTVYGAKYYDVNLFTSKKELENHPQRVKDFTNASIKGWEYALEHQDEIINLILKKYNSQHKTKEALQFEAKQIQSIMLPTVHKIGSIDETRVQIIADNFLQTNFIKNKQYQNIKPFIYKEKMNPLNLTDTELQYLKNRKEILMCIDPNWMPFEAMIEDKYVGINADFIKIIQENLAIPIQIFKTETWSDSIEAAKERKCDILSLAMPTPQRREYLNFTRPYIDVPLIIISKPDKRSVIDISLLEKNKIAVIKDYVLATIIKNKYPNLELVEVSNIKEGLEKLQTDEVFGFAGSSVSIEYYFQNGSYSDFKTIGFFDEKLSLGLAIRNDDAMLNSIFQKIVDKISPQQEQAIIKKWFSLEYKKSFDNSLIWKFLVFIILLGLFLVYRQYDLKRTNKRLKREIEKEFNLSRDKDKIIFHQNKLSAIGEMIENIAHQWRQPLSQVNSAILVLDGLLTQKNIHDSAIEKKLAEIESLTQYMSHTIDDFKDFFAQDKESEIFKLSDIIHNSTSIIESALKHEQIGLSLHVKDEISINGYPRELQQVILIILNNAKDILTNRKTKQAQISLTTQENKNTIDIYICDNAGGIKETIIDKIFDPYFTTKEYSEGTGLGLYISKMLLRESLNGTLNVSNTKEGACFHISLDKVSL